MPDGLYNVAAALLAGVVIRLWWAYDVRQKTRPGIRAPGPVTWVDPRAGSDPATGWLDGSWRMWVGLAVGFAAYTVWWNLAT